MEDRFENFKKWFDLRSEMEDYDTIHGEIEKGIVFRGTNLWILMFAIVVASVGLNMNSTAVIIGAMLISPLMGPINGMGYSLATYDFALLKRSLKNFSFAVGVSLLTSAAYFFVTPVNEAHSELLARTSPTIYDVIIALFGGLAGIVAISSKLKGNVIPGVAIATALMPPICTAGYGLATMQFNFFFGALYLFTINTVFIAFAALIVCQYIKLPIRSIVDPARRKTVNQTISAIILLTIVPSVFFGYKLVQDEHFAQNAKAFLREIAVVEGNYLHNENVNVNQHSVKLVYSGYGLTDENLTQIKELALEHKLDTAKIELLQGFDASIMRENTRKYQSETEQLNNKLTAATFALQQTEKKIDSIADIPKLGEKILTEIKTIYPQIATCTYAETYRFTSTGDSTRRSEKMPLVIFTSPRNAIRTADQRKITEWLQERLNDKNVVTLFENS